MHLGQSIIFTHDKCEYLGKVILLDKKFVKILVIGADVDFFMRYGNVIDLSRKLFRKGDGRWEH